MGKRLIFHTSYNLYHHISSYVAAEIHAVDHHHASARPYGRDRVIKKAMDFPDVSREKPVSALLFVPTHVPRCSSLSAMQEFYKCSSSS